MSKRIHYKFFRRLDDISGRGRVTYKAFLHISFFPGFYETNKDDMIEVIPTETHIAVFWYHIDGDVAAAIAMSEFIQKNASQLVFSLRKDGTGDLVLAEN